ncbi:MAG: prepilin peptidase [Coprococcus sp.]
MRYVPFVVVNILTIFYNVLNIYLFRYEDKKDILKEPNEEKQEKAIESDCGVSKVFIIFMFVMNILLANFLVFFYDNPAAINVKLMFMVSVLWPIAYIDYRTKRIPNAILKITLVARLLFLAPEWIAQKNILHSLLSMSIAVLAVIFACGICCFIMKGSIGMGDIKLFGIMALYMGLEGIWPAIFCSLIASFFIAVYVLVTKKAKRKDNIPFAPAILIGTYISIFLTGI